MAVNKFMHPRNIYRIPPNFEKLSKIHADFSNIAKMDVTGKVTIDFKDPHSLRILTKCLLKSDFNLDVEIPEDRLVPTLPLRLNYILWIEDLMNAILRNSDICGIDIGTGACAIYPLLAAAKNKWHMLATETDPVSLQRALENIQRNNLEQLVKLRNNNGTKLIENLFAEETKDVYDFCMCNPPFYSNLQELYESRSPARLPPKNGFTGSPQELITEGGELKFCRKLIDESKRCKDKVLIFTTMVGHKYNLSELLLDLKAEGIKHTHTEFCQGRVTRWGLAWTYQDHDIYSLVPPRDKPRKKNVPITHQLLPIPNCEYNIVTAYNKIKTIFSELQIQQKTLNKCGNRISLDILARENTWSNQRRKRRLLKRIEAANAKKIKLFSTGSENVKSAGHNTLHKTHNVVASDAKMKQSISSQTGPDIIESIVNHSGITSDMEVVDPKMIQSNSNVSENIETIVNYPDKNFISTERPSNENTDNKADTVYEAVLTSNTCETDSKNSESNYESNHSIAKSVEDKPSNGETSKTNATNKGDVQNPSEEKEPLIHAFLKLYKKDETINLEIEFVDGTGGKESVYQVVQYIKNNWK